MHGPNIRGDAGSKLPRHLWHVSDRDFGGAGQRYNYSRAVDVLSDHR